MMYLARHKSSSSLLLVGLLALLTTACGTDRAALAPSDDAGFDAGFADNDASVDIDASEDLDAGGEDAGPIDDPRQLPRDIRRAAPDLEVALENFHVRMFTREGSSLSEEQKEQFLDAATSALMFNMHELGFSEEEIAAEPRVRVVVLDVSAYNSATGSPDTYGISYPAYGSDGDAFVMPDNSFTDISEMDDTLAHEINHIIVMRRTPDDSAIPWWTIEGTAIDMGSHYGWQVHHAWTGFIKPYVDRARGSDATLTFTRYDIVDLTEDLGQIGHDQAISGFFVEYLRFIHPHGSELGYPDVHTRMLATSMATSDGADFAESFQSSFDGLALDDAKAAYTSFLESTRADLAARYEGTIFE